MTVSRRDFLRTTAILGGAAGLGLPALANAMGPDGVARGAYLPEIGAQPKSLRILFLGGTGFTGPHQVEYALSRGHKVTIFNRGRSQPGLFPGVPRIEGDRNTPGAFAKLGKGEWDVIIDPPVTNPKWVRDAGVALKARAPHYIMLSTISVFSDYSQPVDENGPLHPPADIDAEYDAQAYGSNKVASEHEAARQFRNVTIVRPGLIVGPGDNSDRFSYWPQRIEKGGEIMAPGNPNDPVQYIDARDLAQWVVRLAENKVYGTFNATGPKTPTNIAEMLYGIRAVTSTEARFIWVDADFLREKQVRGWTEMPVWAEPRGGMAAFARVKVDKAFANGLTVRPLADTAKDTLDWYHTQPAERQSQLRAGIAPEKEKAVLAAWKEAKGIK
jgi:2'-hydroxyisoflavone reductase